MSLRRVVVTPAADISPRRLEWLWLHRIPLGKVTVLAGRQGQGKSLLTTLLAAQVSRGAMPGDLHHERAGVLLITGEDDPEDTVTPRLMAAEADLARVGVVDAREMDDLGEYLPGPVSLPGDVPAIAEHARANNVRLIVIDPVTAFLDRDHSALNNQEVRRALAPLAALAAEIRCAVLVVMHLNKSGSTDALARIADSTAFTALARSALLFGSDPDDPDGERGSRKVLTVVKGNLSASGDHTLTLGIESTSVDSDAGAIDTARISVTGQSTASASDLLGDAEERSALKEACEFLEGELADGPQLSKDIKAAAGAADIAARTLRRAKDRLGVKVEKEHGPRGAWLWSLSKASTPNGSSPDGPLGQLTSEDVQGVQGYADRRNGHLALATEAEEARIARLLSDHAEAAA